MPGQGQTDLNFPNFQKHHNSNYVQYFLNHSITGPYSGKNYASKGDVVNLISDHGSVVIVEKDAVRFTAQAKFLSKKEVEAEGAKEVAAPIQFASKSRSKKSITNPQNNIQSLF